MIGFLRFVGMLNAAVWLGAAVFYTMGAAPVLVSRDMLGLLGERYFPYLSTAVAQLVMTRYFYFRVACATIALLHLAAEWLYLGRAIRQSWLGLLAGLFLLGLAGSVWLCPALTKLHRARYAVNASPQQREAAARAFRVWHGVFQAINVLMIGGVVVYFWRAANPDDSLRFVGSAKFRG